VMVPIEPKSGMATGARQYSPLMIRKRIDKSSPLLVKALAENQPVEGEFRFFRPNPVGDGTTEQFYTVVISHGRVASIRQFNPDTLAPTIQLPALEEITFAFQAISWTFTQGGVTFEDSSRVVR
jgi:type VI secretion system secreted protein Hcp